MAGRGTPEGGRKGWITRRARGGLGNEPALRADGTVRPDAIRIDRATGCWNWLLSLAGTSPQGAVEGQTNRPVLVRRWIYERWKGPAAKPLYAGCRNARCVNPDHATTEPVHYSAPSDATIRETAAAMPGATRTALAQRLHVSDKRLARVLGPCPVRGGGGSAWRHWAGRPLPPRPDTVSERDWALFTRAVAGESLTALGMELGVSRERARQLVARVERRLARQEEHHVDDHDQHRRSDRHAA